MIKTLQIIFITILGLLITFWIGDLFLGTPADIKDRGINEGWYEDIEKYKAEIIKSRVRTLFYAIPAIILLFLTLISMKQNNEQKFYWTFLVGLSIFQILPIAGLLNINSESSLFMICFLLTSYISFAIGQLFSIYKILESRKIYSTKKE